MPPDYNSGPETVGTDDPDTDSGMDQKDEGSDTFFVPKAALAGKQCKAGDTLTFTVLGLDSDGDAEVKLEGYDEGKAQGGSMGDDLRAALTKKGPM